MFWDTEAQRVYTEDEIRTAWNEMDQWERDEYENDFDSYLTSCLCQSGGVLVEIDTIYQNIECGNVHFTKAEMLKEAEEMYDVGDPCNPLTWEEYYRVINA